MFKKVLIANRGEIALRIIRACRELGIISVAVYSDADVDSMHVQLADEAVCIGSGPSSESYLKIDRILAAAEIAEAEAIHPGYGFLSENSVFAAALEAENITFIGIQEEFAASIQKLNQQFNWQLDYLEQRANASTSNFAKPISAENLEKIQKHIEPELAVYRRAMEIFEERY